MDLCILREIVSCALRTLSRYRSKRSLDGRKRPRNDNERRAETCRSHIEGLWAAGASPRPI